jgi:hypothetical protein
MQCVSLAAKVYSTAVGRRLNRDVQRPDNIENYGELATATATARKLEENIRATPPKMKITAQTCHAGGVDGLTIEKMGSTSP